MLDRAPHPEPTPTQDLVDEAARTLAEARALSTALHHPGARDRHRALLDAAIEAAQRALALLQPPPLHNAPNASPHSSAVLVARSTLILAHAAQAEDALHGAGQLSLSAQRAPTLESCEDGWRRVETIVAVAEHSATIAAQHAALLEGVAPRRARAALLGARRAEAAARAARRIVDERNHAYTFHTDGGFSFGEGWYLAAAAVLTGVTIQIEPGKPGTAPAEKFLLDAGLAAQLQPYRSRPRSMKHATSLVARAFRADPLSAQQRLRLAFLGTDPIPKRIQDWIDSRIPPGSKEGDRSNKVLLWIRDGVHHSHRNTSLPELLDLVQRVQRAGLLPILTGDALRQGPIPPGALDMILFWKEPTFRQLDARRAQLQFFEHLKHAHGLVGQIGVTTAGMDGPALMGLPTLYLTDQPNVRMREWVDAVPGYTEVVRQDGYLDRISRVLESWASPTTTQSP